MTDGSKPEIIIYIRNVCHDDVHQAGKSNRARWHALWIFTSTWCPQQMCLSFKDTVGSPRQAALGTAAQLHEIVLTQGFGICRGVRATSEYRGRVSNIFEHFSTLLLNLSRIIVFRTICAYAIDWAASPPFLYPPPPPPAQPIPASMSVSEVYSREDTITNFFKQTRTDRYVCERKALELVGGTVIAVEIQGVCSYTVFAGQNLEYVVQFRLNSLKLKL